MQRHESKIYIVDDDPSVRRSLKRLLESIGHSVEASATAEELLEKRPLEAGCLVLDVRLPGLSGFELYDRLMAGGNPLPVIFVTAHYDETMKKRAEAMGALAYLEKPIVDDELMRLIDEAVKQ
jgi:FixJ family two-component response regulator